MVNVLIKKDAHLYHRYHECSQCESILEFTNYDLTEKNIQQDKFKIRFYELNCPNCRHVNKIDSKAMYK